MTVRELIEKLQRLPQDAIVVREVAEIDKELGAPFVTDYLPAKKVDGQIVYDQYTFTEIEFAYTLDGQDRPDLAYVV